jgi:hypothetical protein
MYYDQAVGRFISEDSMGFEAGPDFYSYVNGNPVNYTNPMGLQAPAPAPMRPAIPVPVPEPPPPGTGLGPLALCAANPLACAILISLADPGGPGDWANSPDAQFENRCKNKNKCKPCVPPVGTIAYQEDTDPNSRPHDGIPPRSGSCSKCTKIRTIANVFGIKLRIGVATEPVLRQVGQFQSVRRKGVGHTERL